MIINIATDCSYGSVLDFYIVGWWASADGVGDLCLGLYYNISCDYFYLYYIMFVVNIYIYTYIYGDMIQDWMIQDNMIQDDIGWYYIRIWNKIEEKRNSRKRTSENM